MLGLFAHALGSTTLEADLAERLLLYPWPYNVREVLSLAKQLRIRGGAGPYGLSLIEGQLEIPASSSVPASVPARAPEETSSEAEEGGEREPAPDRAGLEALLKRHRGVVADVAREMSRSRKQVYRWITHHGIDVESFRQ